MRVSSESTTCQVANRAELAPHVADKSRVSEQAVNLGERLEAFDVVGRVIYRQASVPPKLLDPVLEECLSNSGVR